MAAYKLQPSQIVIGRDGDLEMFFCTNLKAAYDWMMLRVADSERQNMRSYTTVALAFRNTGSYRIKSKSGNHIRLFKGALHKKYVQNVEFDVNPFH